MATDSNIHGRITTQKLILIRLTNTNNSTLHYTPTIQATCSRNMHTPKQTHLTHNTPPWRTDPHTLAHSGSMFGDTGCGIGWSVSVTPACPSRLIFGPFEHQSQSRSVWCNPTVFQWVNGHCLFSLLLMEWSEGEKSSEKRETYDDQVFFPSSWECFTL